MHKLIIAWLALAGTAHAEPSPDAAALLRAGKLVVRDGRCDALPAIADRVRALDPDFYRDVFANDREIESCNLTAIVADLVPLSGLRVVGQAATGFGLGLAGALVGGFAGLGLGYAVHGSDTGAGVGGVAGLAIGYAVGASLGVYLVGEIGDQHCSGSWTLAASMITVLPSVLLAITPSVETGVGAGRQTNLLGAVEVGLIIGGPVVGAIVGCGLTTHRDDAPASIGALVQLRGGRIGMGVPIITHDRRDTNVPLFSASF